ncbi:MAG TPA: hypothetical protein VMU48_22100 [Terracidiphilus sp.]|nr:hypothetical protein [Terracidiphilus sp.]
MNEEGQFVTDMTQDALEAMLKRAMRNTLILGTIPAVAVAIGSGWRNGAMLVIGALISAASIWEWLRLARVINARLDQKKSPTSAPVVVLFFLLRLAVFGGVIYGSLKGLHGSAVALLCGLGLAVLTLSWEAIRLLRN